MTLKSGKVEVMVKPFAGLREDGRYLAFFDCFNRQLFFEAHEVLEDLWLGDRGPDRRFYQGLIQLAGAFVHIRKNRRGPAIALLKLAHQNLSLYPPQHHFLLNSELLVRLRGWWRRLEEAGTESLPEAVHGGSWPSLKPGLAAYELASATTQELNITG